MRPLGKPVHKPTGKEKVARFSEKWLERKQENLFLG